MSTAAKYKITLIPDTMIFDGKQFLNNIDIDAPTFYQKLRESKELPTSSHPNISEYITAYKSACDCDEILCIGLTSKMSGSFNTSKIAANQFAEEDIGPVVKVYDSLQVSHGLGLMTIEAAKLAQEGKTADEIIAALDEIRDKIGVYFIMKSLENARKGGRIGAIKATAADVLSLKPILEFSDGLPRDIGIVRGFDNAFKELFNNYIKNADPTKECIIFHADNKRYADELKLMILDKYPQTTISIEWVGAVIGIYTGDGCVGLAFHRR